MSKKKVKPLTPKVDSSKVEGLHSEVIHQEIIDTLELNYMPYAMSVIVSRAIPEIDGFKPSHRKLLYTMYKMGLLAGNRTKSANIVGQTMKLNPHGDSAIYDTMVRLSKGYDALLTPFVDSKGNFGKSYSRDMAYAASRYTEAKLSSFSSEIFKDIDKDTVDFVDNYDGTMKEPRLLPTVFPNILVSSNTGIAVGMASQICGFNLNEVCSTVIEMIQHPKKDIMKTLLAPDFTTGGELLYNEDELRQIYETGRGSFKVRARWRYIKENNVIEIYEIPYSTTVEAIIDKIVDLVKTGKVRDISDIRDETDLKGLKITIDLKRGTDPDRLMQKLFKMTTLMDTYSCNFNILVNGSPRVLGVKEILTEWLSWRENCIHRRVSFDLKKKQDRLHLLQGLEQILLDLDKAITIIRETSKESEVVANLMEGFHIDEIQAEYVAELKLRNINKEYILKRISDSSNLKSDIKELSIILEDPDKIKSIVVKELKEINKKYPTPRKTGIVYNEDALISEEIEEIEDYNVEVFLTKDGYFKKITSQSLAGASDHKLKEGDQIISSISAKNIDQLLFFTNKQQVYIGRLNEFDNVKASFIGVYLPSHFEFDEGEEVVSMVHPGDYASDLVIFFENGKAVKLPLSLYQTKNRRRKLTGAYSDKSTLKKVLKVSSDTDIAVYTRFNRLLVYNTSVMNRKMSRTAQGVQVIQLKSKDKLVDAKYLSDVDIEVTPKYRCNLLPGTGRVISR